MVENQAYLFLVFTLTGFIIGALFDVFRILRKSFKTSDFITYLEDILFWVLTGFLIIYNIWYFNDGEIRLFMFLGLIMGILIYLLLLSKFFIILMTFIIDIIKKILKILQVPFKPIIKFCKKIIYNISKIVKMIENSIKLKTKRGKIEKDGE